MATENNLVKLGMPDTMAREVAMRTIISGQSATRTLLHSETGSTVLFDRAAGIVYTLPPPRVGVYYDFVVSTAITSNAAEVDTSGASVFLLGAIESIINASATTSGFAANGTSHVKIASNGSTTGGLAGSVFRLTCISSTQWVVTGVLVGSGALATPFA